MNAHEERRNMANDARNCEADKAPVLYVKRDGFVDEIPLPTHWTVCPVCKGEGSHVNPSIDASGLTAEDFADDPDFADDYMSGVYDQPCNRCEGRRVVRSVDLDKLPVDQRAAYERQLREDAETRAIERAEWLAGA